MHSRATLGLYCALVARFRALLRRAGLGMFEILGLKMSFGTHSRNVCYLCEMEGGKKTQCTM